MTRAWLHALARGRVLELALALALGYAAMTLVRAATDVLALALAQNVADDSELQGYGTLQYLFDVGIYLLNFSIGGTVIFYGTVLSATLALVLIALVGLVVVRARDRVLGACPFCASRIPHGSTHCAYCGSSIEPERA